MLWSEQRTRKVSQCDITQNQVKVNQAKLKRTKLRFVCSLLSLKEERRTTCIKKSMTRGGEFITIVLN